MAIPSVLVSAQLGAKVIEKVALPVGPYTTMILWENVAYLADDERRQEAFQMLKKRIGTEPAQVLSASEEALLEVTGHGIRRSC